jgi:hypothetical protein
MLLVLLRVWHGGGWQAARGEGILGAPQVEVPVPVCAKRSVYRSRTCFFVWMMVALPVDVLGVRGLAMEMLETVAGALLARAARVLGGHSS